MDALRPYEVLRTLPLSPSGSSLSRMSVRANFRFRRRGRQAGGVGAIARFLGGDADEASSGSVVLAALNTLQDVCRNSERNRDAFIYTNMDQVSAVFKRRIVGVLRCAA